MKNKSDIESIKSVAISFLYQDVEETEFSPIVVSHPVFESAFVGVKRNGQMQIVNILDNNDDLLFALKQYKQNIIRQNDINSIYMIIRKSYRLTFLKFIKEYLSVKDMSKLLAHAWISSENPNQDVNVPVTLVAKWFKQADKKVLMNKDEYAYYQSLPQTITAYRGVAVGRNPNGLSWTCNLDTAEWFANRYNTESKQGYVQSIEVDKSYVLAYFNNRDEDELVLDIVSENFSINII